MTSLGATDILQCMRNVSLASPGKHDCVGDDNESAQTLGHDWRHTRGGPLVARKARSDEIIYRK